MNDEAVVQFINAMSGIVHVTAVGDHYFFYDPDKITVPEKRFPFVTIMTGDRYDKASNLDRPGVFRLNIGVSRETYLAMFAPPPPFSPKGDVLDTGHDYTPLDKLFPHPVYAPMFWVSVLNPSDAVFEAKIRPLLAEAYASAAQRYENKAGG